MRLKHLIFLIFIFFSYFLLAQNKPRENKKIRAYLVEAHSLFENEDYKAAKILYTKIIEDLNKQKSWEDWVKAKTQLALILIKQNKKSTGLSDLLELSKIAESRLPDNSLNLAMVYHKIGVQYFNYFDDFEKSVFYQEKALRIRLLNEYFPIKDEVRSYRNIGEVYDQLNQPDKALIFLQKAVKLIEQHSDQIPMSLSVQTQLLYGTLLMDYGFIDKAKNYLEYVYQYMLANESEPYWDKAFTIHQIAYLNKVENRFETAKKFYLQAIAIYEKETEIDEIDQENLADLYYELGDTYSKNQQLDSALLFLNKSLRNNYLINREAAAFPDIYFEIASVYQLLKKFNHSNYWLQKAIPINEKEQRNPQQADVYALMATNFWMLGKFEEALNLAQKGIRYLAKRDLSNALTILALDEYRQVHNIFFPVLVTKAQILFANYQENGKITYLKSTEKNVLLLLDYLHQNRQKVNSQNSKLFAVKDAKKVYELGIQIELEKLKLTNTKTEKENALATIWTYFEQSKSLVLLEALNNTKAKEFSDISASDLIKEKELLLNINFYENQSLKTGLSAEQQLDNKKKLLGLKTEYESFLVDLEQQNPSYYQAKYDWQTIDLKTLQTQLLADNQACISYFLGEKNSYAFVISKAEKELVLIPTTFLLTNWVQQFRTNLLAYSLANQPTEVLYQKSATKFTQNATQLYDQLLKPIKAQIDLPERVMILPDDVLGYLPFELLISQLPSDASTFINHDYLIKNHQIAYNYSATLWQKMQQKSQVQAQETFVGFAPIFEVSQPTNFPSIAARRAGLGNLLYNSLEIENIYTEIGGSILLGKEANRKNFFELADKAKILHLSTHAKANETEGIAAFLAFASPREGEKPELVYNRELYNLQLNADMVVLSACETGIGELKKGEGIISLARGFTYAGAKSIITALWSANDQSTANLMVDFYRQLKEGKTKEAALRNAKLNFIENATDHKSAHPFKWGTFIVIGDTQALNFSRFSKWKWGSVGLLILGGLFWFWRKKRAVDLSDTFKVSDTLDLTTDK